VALEGPPADVFANEDALRGLRLEPPEIVRLRHALARGGVPLDAGVLTVDQLVASLTALAGRGP
jgi:energy-coupling factor transport system ATP-binding protein